MAQFGPSSSVIGMPRTKKPVSLSEYGLDQNLIGQIHDLREAFLGAPEYRAVAHALEWFFKYGIDADPELKRRYEEAQKARTSAKTK
jgi:hypothetical protein